MKTLRPKKYTEQEFFIADEVAITSFRDELASMEHPFFALKGGDTKVREYINDNVTVTVKTTVDGVATIFDKDVWIYQASTLNNVKSLTTDMHCSHRTCCPELSGLFYP